MKKHWFLFFTWSFHNIIASNVIIRIIFNYAEGVFLFAKTDEPLNKRECAVMNSIKNIILIPLILVFMFSPSTGMGQESKVSALSQKVDVLLRKYNALLMANQKLETELADSQKRIDSLKGQLDRKEKEIARGGGKLTTDFVTQPQIQIEIVETRTDPKRFYLLCGDIDFKLRLQYQFLSE